MTPTLLSCAIHLLGTHVLAYATQEASAAVVATFEATPTNTAASLLLLEYSGNITGASGLTFPAQPGLNDAGILLNVALTGIVGPGANYVMQDIPYLYVSGVTSTFTPWAGSAAGQYDKELLFLISRADALAAAILQWTIDNQNTPAELDKLESPTFVQTEILDTAYHTLTPAWTDIATNFGSQITVNMGATNVPLGGGYLDTISLRQNGTVNFQDTVVTYLRWGDGSPDETPDISALSPNVNHPFTHAYSASGAYTKELRLLWPEDNSFIDYTETIIVT